MVKVRFFGMIRMKIKESSLEIEADSVSELLKKLPMMFAEIAPADLKNCIIYVNGTDIVKLKLYGTALKEGDEVQVFSPVAGG
ncbi:MoaD/ThiS family protein [Lutispora saccharofermentans]|uniref:MoaD/ThiS family protein n=1 Tax=Lutispora saccharofermentans TaxID=3024236 RepID=A0ABT1NFI4_9FIRM|nr:MoaD/ThiS family protein [Lutispora saccharofermentans]